VEFLRKRFAAQLLKAAGILQEQLMMIGVIVDSGCWNDLHETLLEISLHEKGCFGQFEWTITTHESVEYSQGIATVTIPTLYHPERSAFAAVNCNSGVLSG